MEVRQPRIALQCMPHESGIRREGEDWAGITNQKERKRLQNRLNKRLSRQRKKQDAKIACAAREEDDRVLAVRHSHLEASSSDIDFTPSFAYCTPEDIVLKRELLKQFTIRALASYATGDPRADHRIGLIQLNIINGLSRNAAALGFSFDWLICEVVSPFGRGGQPSVHEQFCLDSTPPNLIPTDWQLRTTHHPWMDLLPLPQLRQNLFEVSARLSPEAEEKLHDELFRDIVESVQGGAEWRGLAVWGDPWDTLNWEMSEPFARRWAWLLQGCEELLEATNGWRDLRGENPIPGSERVTELHD